MKKLFTLIITILITAFSFAQPDLFVGTGGYVYVDGAAFTSGPTVAPLYVTDDINLAADGHIYLRNQAQLIQGNSVGNSGTGQLSVYQTGDANVNMYNYWSSPVGLNAGVAGNTTFRANNVLYGETTAPITSLPATFVSAPNYDGVAGAPPVIADYWLFSFVGVQAPPNDYLDWSAIGSTGTLASGLGFTMKGNASSAQQYDFRGRPNNGTINVPLNANRQTFVGNPYPSAIDAREFIHGNANNAGIINAATLSFWEQDPASSTSHVLANYAGGYATYTINAAGTTALFTPATFDTYNADGTLNTPGASSTTGKQVFRYIAIGQGFTVESNGTGGSIQFTNTMRVFQKESPTFSEFFRTSDDALTRPDDEIQYNENGLSIVPEDYQRFRLNMDFNDTYTRQLTQTFHHTATNGEDYGLETISSTSHASNAYWPLNDKKFNAQAFAYDQDLRIPLVIEITEAQGLSVRSRIFDVQNFDASQSIYFHDKVSGVYTNLREENFEIFLESGEYTNRFEITFQSEALSVTEITSKDFDVFQNTNNNELTVLNPNGLAVKSVSLFDVTGKNIINAKNLGSQPKYLFSTKAMSEGVYIATITVDDNRAFSKKVIIKN